MNDRTINERVTKIRKTLKMTQTEFAKQLGIRQTALSMIELGNNTLTRQNTKLICMSFNVNENWLMDGNGEMFNASPFETEFFRIYSGLSSETQQALLRLARELLEIQSKPSTQSGQD